jgi:hypothetical protein
MADPSTLGTVDGVVPSILVKYVGNPSLQDTTESIKLYDDDNGINRRLVLNGDSVWVTNKDLAAIGAATIEILEDKTASTIVPVGPPAPQNPPQSFPKSSSDLPPVQG